MHFFIFKYFVNARAYVWLIGVRPTYTLVYNLHVVELIWRSLGSAPYRKSPKGSYRGPKGRSRKRARLGPQKHEIRVRRQKVFQHLHTVGEILKLVLKTLYFLK